MKNRIKKRIAVMLAVIAMLSMTALFATATCTYQTNAFNVPTTSKYAKVYTLSSSGTTIPYTSKYLSTRGTTNGASKSAYIDNRTDELYLMDAGVTNGKAWAYVSYPISSGRRNAYIYLSSVTKAGYNSSHLYYASSSGKFYCSPRKGGSLSSSYWVDKGDKVYVFYAENNSGTNVQIMYPASGKWRIAWCRYSDAVRYLDNVSSSASYTGYVNTSSSPLVLRAGASTSAKALANMPKGSQLTVLDNKAQTNGFYHVRYNGTTGYASARYISFSKPTVSSFDPIWPCASSGDYTITTLYYYRNYNNGAKHGCNWDYRYAIDISGSAHGNIVAVEAGTVELAKWNGGFGNCVIIRHDNGTKSLYGHLSSIRVSVGQRVSKGSVIGVMGSTGNSSGPHLHFELSDANPFMKYYNSKYAGKIKIDPDVYYSAKNHSSDSNSKELYNLLNSSYKLSGGYYIHK